MAAQRYCPAVYYIGRCYRDGLSLERNLTLAKEYYEHAAGGQGFELSPSFGCIFFALGSILEKSWAKVEGMKLLEKAADQGCCAAMVNLDFQYM